MPDTFDLYIPNPTMPYRKSISKFVETEVLVASRRRCCMCVYLEQSEEVRKGQIAHLNRDPGDARFGNLVWLCFDHHDEFDCRTSQSKGFTTGEVKRYRDMLYVRYQGASNDTNSPKIVPKHTPPSATSIYGKLKSRFPEELGFMSEAWEYPLWQVANRPDFFAYKASNGSDGMCLIERIDLPDGRIVIACIQTPGNPGQSITNAIEAICFQVCERFEIPADRLVWLEHYEIFKDAKWHLVKFAQMPPDSFFADPEWILVTPEIWKDLKLRPRKQIVSEHGRLHSMLDKLFDWPTEALS